jgi:hypothetical protein
LKKVKISMMYHSLSYHLFQIGYGMAVFKATLFFNFYSSVEKIPVCFIYYVYGIRNF